MTPIGKAMVVIVLAGGVLGVRTIFQRSDRTAAAAPAASPPAMTFPSHADHFPRHGGLVFMNGDTHLEVILSSDGSASVYFTNAVRQELPPTYASEVTMGMTSGERRQQIDLRMESGRNVWVGRLDTPADPYAIVRVSYAAEGERPYWIDLPWSAFQSLNATSAATKQ
jgi:hypothetical protein